MPKEIEQSNQFGFSKGALTTYLIKLGLLHKDEVIVSWEINERDFLNLDIKRKEDGNKA